MPPPTRNELRPLQRMTTTTDTRTMTRKTLNVAIYGVLAAIFVTTLGAAPASAEPTGHRPWLQTTFVKHDAWETVQTYKDTVGPNWTYTDYARTRLIRRNRSVIDVRFQVMFSKDWSGCMEKPGHPATYWGPGGTNPAEAECPEGSIWSEEWSGEIHTWTMRYRAGQALYTVHLEHYFPGDRYATTDPSSRRFGGLALDKRDVSGVYAQSKWDHPLAQWVAYPPDPY